jgi:hypothetical protein
VNLVGTPLLVQNGGIQFIQPHSHQVAAHVDVFRNDKSNFFILVFAHVHRTIDKNLSHTSQLVRKVLVRLEFAIFDIGVNGL